MAKLFEKISNIFKFIFIAILLILIDTLFIEPNIFLSSPQQLNVPNWSKDLDGFKIVLISDIHLGTRFVDMKKLNEIVNITNKNNPDLIVICGDLDTKAIRNKRYSITEVANSLKKLNSKYGIYSIMGNHDYEYKEDVYEVYKQANIKLLKNQDDYINVKNKKIRIVGLEDLWFRNTDPQKIIGKDNKNIPTIVLAHNPDYFPQIPKHVSLTLSGHTHGGEIVFPFIGAFFVPSRYGNRYRYGHIIENGRHLFVSRGIATLGYGRFLSPAEINILDIYAETSAQKDTKPLAGKKECFSPDLIIKFRSFYKIFIQNN